MDSNQHAEPRFDFSNGIQFIASKSGTVHILPPVDWRQDTTVTRTSFADALLNGHRPRLLCGRRLFVDWTESGSVKAAKPTGEFEDEALCRNCMNVMGDQQVEVFEQLIREEASRG